LAGFPKLSLTVDSWFDGADFVNGVDNLGVTLIGQFKSNRKVKVGISPLALWTNIKTFFKPLDRESISATIFKKKKNPKLKWFGFSKIYIKKSTTAARYNSCL
jgi:hypothetical protein